MRCMQNSPKIGFHPYLRRSVLEDVCIYNNDIFEVSTSRSTTRSSNSSNNHTTIISSKLICFNKQIDLFIQHSPSFCLLGLVRLSLTTTLWFPTLLSATLSHCWKSGARVSFTPATTMVTILSLRVVLCFTLKAGPSLQTHPSHRRRQRPGGSVPIPHLASS